MRYYLLNSILPTSEPGEGSLPPPTVISLSLTHIKVIKLSTIIDCGKLYTIKSQFNPILRVAHLWGRGAESARGL